MTISIITINRNNAVGLEKTMLSVARQTYSEIEYILVDGASTDNSVEVVQKYAGLFGDRLKWVSEKDSGIYNAMNKGIRMASGDYVEFLNSGDCLTAPDVTERMLKALEEKGCPGILYGNMLKLMADGSILQDRGFAGQDVTFLSFFNGTLNHSSAYIRRSLFDKYGLYDETLKIVSDWKWYLQAIALGKEKPEYSDVDVTLFDMTGISETNKDLDKTERKKVLEDLVPASILADYEQWAFPIGQMKRLKRHPWAYKVVWFIERSIFKKEKAQGKIKKEGICQ